MPTIYDIIAIQTGIILICGFIGWLFGYTAIGFFVGITIVGSFYVFMFIIIVKIHWFHWWQPICPPCKNKKCKRNSFYKQIECDSGNDRSVLECTCGARYASFEDKKFRYFMQISNDGSQIPYMKRTHLGRWKVEKQLKDEVI